jgi:hypothetical protein
VTPESLAVNERRTSRWQTALGAVLLIALVGWVALGILEQNHYRRYLPGKLQVTGSVFIDSNEDVGTVVMALLVRPEFCGTAIFELSPATRRAIEADGLAFFEGATWSRGRFDKNGTGPEGAAQTYEAWQRGPLPHDWTRHGLWSGLLCTDISPKMARLLNQAAADPGAVYTQSIGGGNALVVLPSLGWVVFTYWD